MSLLGTDVKKITHFIHVGQLQMVLLELFISCEQANSNGAKKKNHKFDVLWDLVFQDVIEHLTPVVVNRVFSQEQQSTKKSHKSHKSTSTKQEIITGKYGKIAYQFMRRSVKQMVLMGKAKLPPFVVEDERYQDNRKTQGEGGNHFDFKPFPEKLVVNVTVQYHSIKHVFEVSTPVNNGGISDYFSKPTTPVTVSNKKKKTNLKKIVKRMVSDCESDNVEKAKGTSEHYDTEEINEEDDDLETKCSEQDEACVIDVDLKEDSVERKIADCIIDPEAVNVSPSSSGDYSEGSHASSAIDLDYEEVPDLENISIEDLTSQHLTYLVFNMENKLREIFEGKRYSRRHMDYKAGGKAKGDLGFQVNFGLFNEDQQEMIMDLLMKIFCYRHCRYLDYVTKVILPETLILICMEIEGGTHEEVDLKLFTSQVVKNV